MKLLLVVFLLTGVALGATKPHTVTFGKWTTVKWFADRDENKPVDLKVRALLVDGHVKEFTIGPSHEITERLFVVRRAYRLNDALPDDKASGPNWRWERGGWMLVDRLNGHISATYLPEFDSYLSVASWYRDYAAYCGVSDDGDKTYFVVTQLGVRKPVLKKLVRSAVLRNEPDSACPAPVWTRQPARVTFTSNSGDNSSYEVRGRAIDLIRDETEEDAGTQ